MNEKLKLILMSFIFDVCPGLLIYVVIFLICYATGTITGKSGFVGYGSTSWLQIFFYIGFMPSFYAFFLYASCPYLPSYNLIANVRIDGKEMEITELNGKIRVEERGSAAMRYLILRAIFGIILVPVYFIIWIVTAIKILISKNINVNEYTANDTNVLLILCFLITIISTLPSLCVNKYYSNKYNNLRDLTFTMESITIKNSGARSNVNFNIILNDNTHELDDFDGSVYVEYESQLYYLCGFYYMGRCEMSLWKQNSGVYSLFYQKSAELYNLNYYVKYSSATLKHGSYKFKSNEKKYDSNNIQLDAFYFYKKVIIDIK